MDGNWLGKNSYMRRKGQQLEKNKEKEIKIDRLSR